LRDCVEYKMASDKLLDAIVQVESGGSLNAIGDKGKAIGPMQIHEIYYKDAVQHDPSLQSGKYAGYTYNNCKGEGSLEYSKDVARAYFNRYATPGRLGHDPTDEDMARIHNGGPNGYKWDSTKEYGRKVLDKMK